MNLYEQLVKDYDKELTHSGVNGERLASRLDELSRIGLMDSGGVTRPGYSAEEKEAKELVIKWMKNAGLTVTEDGAGNVFGRLEGKTAGPSIASGSHVDSVPNGGHFDGPLGVLSALEVAESWRETGFIPEKPYEIVIFSDEEGSRFKSSLTGSRAFMGQLKPEEMDSLHDENGKTFREVLSEYGSSAEECLKAGRNGREFETFVEVHIEQGKVLERENQPVGVVKGIAGPASLEVTFTGEAGHAGNTPMAGRRDPLVAASLFVAAIENFPKQISDTAVATVGKLNVHPNGFNVIAQEVILTVDIRDIFEETRDQLLDLIKTEAVKIAEERGIDVQMNLNAKIKPLPISEILQAGIAESLTKFNINPVYIPSGAGHDTMIVGTEVPAAMLFVRSRDGISHNPREWTSLNDCVYGVHVLKHFVEGLMKK
ncbi:N-carbamoyl-L-amino acid amidohydrolase [Cytobacillus firmus]|uniref:M20 family metallo-hydrolase n=1 Tax=Cytobacillus firmus TaxID=1399 RepID=UPI00077C97C4|nr:M20 family metallo-hydrolase [Cytobacillus firmus]MBG9542852.1 N-carbamoyl-L-amino acid amidohydrolase [Cytobacillus firmus]MBG9554265.1 N-carbamoyl-L-amino acid amidohydrolase [Cytobacillus firmus]MBG9557068.1 N-carbamoyl-L-amino acid amidohydrolase [Cytobacillus firmus]MBG9576574.1 N-carbamoyl-L-amino acid amidohydrolase [Cytobacillus firmus]MEC1891484.1 M20 family metallo-hydrolase [Cytobacillus firmus]